MPRDDPRSPAPAGRVLAGPAALWTVAAVLGLMFMGGALPTPLYPIYQREFHFSEVVLTLLFAIYVAGALAALLLLGRVSDQIGRRRTMLPAIVVAAISTLAFLLPVSLPVLFVGRFLSGVAIGVASGTATAWIAELEPAGHRGHATVVAVGANQIGLALGPLLAGCLAQFEFDPLRLTYAVYLGLLLPAAFAAAKAKETIAEPAVGWRDLALRPRIGVPDELRTQFVPPAVTAFGIFALLGFSTALIPTVLIKSLHKSGPDVGGLLVVLLFLTGALTVVIGRRVSGRAAMFAGLVLLLPTLTLLVFAQTERSLAILIGESAIAGVATSLGYRGSLQSVNEMAPKGRHAELVSSYLVACYCGVSLPVIGIGLISQLVNGLVADLVFAIAIGVAALLAIAIGMRCTPRPE